MTQLTSTHLQLIEEQERQAFDAVAEGARQRDAERASTCLSMATAWQSLKQITHDLLIKQEASTLHFHMDSWFLQDLIRHLTPGPDEVATYVTGNHLNETDRVLTRYCAVKHAHQSVARAIGERQSCQDVLIEIDQHGLQLDAMARCHPGNGPDATHPSHIDMNYMNAMASAGADLLGLIVTRDGYVRFFAADLDFDITIHGTGVDHVSKTVWHIALD